MLQLLNPFVLKSTHEQATAALAARCESIRRHRDEVSSRLTKLQDEYRQLERSFNAMEARYDQAIAEQGELKAWVVALAGLIPRLSIRTNRRVEAYSTLTTLLKEAQEKGWIEEVAQQEQEEEQSA